MVALKWKILLKWMMYGLRGITVSPFQVSGQVELDNGAAKAGRINYGKSSLLIRKSTILWAMASIAMLNYQRVYLFGTLGSLRWISEFEQL